MRSAAAAVDILCQLRTGSSISIVAALILRPAAVWLMSQR